MIHYIIQKKEIILNSISNSKEMIIYIKSTILILAIFNFTNKDLNNVNPIKNLKNYHSFSTPRNHYININNNIEEITKQKTKFENIDTNYRMNTNGNENKRDENADKIEIDNNKIINELIENNIKDVIIKLLSFSYNEIKIKDNETIILSLAYQILVN